VRVGDEGARGDAWQLPLLSALARVRHEGQTNCGAACMLCRLLKAVAL